MGPGVSLRFKVGLRKNERDMEKLFIVTKKWVEKMLVKTFAKQGEIFHASG